MKTQSIYATLMAFCCAVFASGNVLGQGTVIRSVSNTTTNTAALGGSAGASQKGSDCTAGKGDACGCWDSCGPCYLFGPEEPWTLFCNDSCNDITVGGWASLGYHSNNTPRSVANNDALAFNDHPDRVNLHQSWLYIEKLAMSDGCSWDWGFRADLMYGTDAAKTQGFGGNGWDTSWDPSGYWNPRRTFHSPKNKSRTP